MSDKSQPEQSIRAELFGEDVFFKFTRLGYRGDISSLDAEGKSLLWRSGDMRARLLLNDLASAIFVPYSHPECAATSTLIHAERYLADRLVYELYPWPKGMIRVEEESEETK